MIISVGVRPYWDGVESRGSHIEIRHNGARLTAEYEALRTNVLPHFRQESEYIISATQDRLLAKISGTHSRIMIAGIGTDTIISSEPWG